MNKIYPFFLKVGLQMDMQLVKNHVLDIGICDTQIF